MGPGESTPIARSNTLPGSPVISGKPGADGRTSYGQPRDKPVHPNAPNLAKLGPSETKFKIHTNSHPPAYVAASATITSVAVDAVVVVVAAEEVVVVVEENVMMVGGDVEVMPSWEGTSKVLGMTDVAEAAGDVASSAVAKESQDSHEVL